MRSMEWLLLLRSLVGVTYTPKCRFGQCTPNELQSLWKKSKGRAIVGMREWRNVTSQKILMRFRVLSLKKRCLRRERGDGLKEYKKLVEKKVSNLFSISMVRNRRVWDIISWREPNKIQIRYKEWPSNVDKTKHEKKATLDVVAFLSLKMFQKHE